MSEQTKQDVIVEMVKAGKSTRDEIIAAANCTTKAFASYLTTMRNAAKFTGAVLCPTEVEVDGKKVMVAKLYAEVMAGREERKAAAKPGKLDAKSPAEKYALAQKRVEKADTALAKFEEKIAVDGKFSKNTEGWFRFEAAKIEKGLADLLLSLCQAPEAEVAPEVPEADGELL